MNYFKLIKRPIRSINQKENGMKNLLLLTLLFVATSAMASDKIMPTIYGKVNKEVGYVTQKKDMAFNKFTGGKDTFNSGTRLGAKNTHELDSMKASYKVELGIGSSTSATDVTVREAKLDLSDFWGTATVGQTYAATGMVGLELDPFSHTGVGWTGVDQSKLVRQAVADGIGYYYRGRKEILGYTTPDLMGLQLSVSFDQNGRAANLSDTQGLRNRDTVEGLLSFKKEMDNMGVKVYAGVSQFVGKETVVTNTATAITTATKEDKSMLFGGQFSFNPVTVGVLYQDRKLKTYDTATPTVTISPKHNWLSGSLKVNVFEKDFVALTYASYTYDNGVANATKNKYSQIAAGYQHQYGDYLTLRLTAANYTIKDKAVVGVLPETTKNSGTLVLAGAQLAF